MIVAIYLAHIHHTNQHSYVCLMNCVSSILYSCSPFDMNFLFTIFIRTMNISIARHTHTQCFLYMILDIIFRHCLTTFSLYAMCEACVYYSGVCMPFGTRAMTGSRTLALACIKFIAVPTTSSSSSSCIIFSIFRLVDGFELWLSVCVCLYTYMLMLLLQTRQN